MRTHIPVEHNAFYIDSLPAVFIQLKTQMIHDQIGVHAGSKLDQRWDDLRSRADRVDNVCGIE